MNPPLVSVILPCFNAASTLARAVESIVMQGFADWEIILFDDGSTDDSPGIARSLAAKDARIHAMTSPHVGIVEALRRACGAASGRYLARMDADDVSHPDRLALQVELMERDSGVALCGTQVEMKGAAIGYGRARYRSWIDNLVSHDDIVRELFVECPIPHPTFMMRRDAYERLGGYEDHGWPEDYDLCMRAFVAGMRFGKVARPLLEWTESPDRLSMRDPRYSPEQFRAIKRHYLFDTYLHDRGAFYQWGAGEVGKPWLREWGRRGPLAVVDINPRKIGRSIHGIRVIAPEDLPAPGDAFTVIAVGAPTAREEIRAWFAPRGYTELRDFLFLA